MSAHDVAIEVHRLTKSFNGRAVVRELSMQVRRGRIYGFLGPNGSGKTTTIRMLCGLLTPDGGRGECLGFDILSEARKIKRRVGYMTQRFSLYSDLSVEENLEFVAQMHGMRNARGAARAMVSHLKMDGLRSVLAGSLSGGWKQRLALGACTLPGPQLLLLDEPTAGVDPKARREFWADIHELAATGVTVLVSTHYMDEAERCHEVAYISEGAVVAQGAIPDLLRDSGLVALRLVGPDIGDLASDLAGKKGVELVTPYGDSLHICGSSAEDLEAAVKSCSDPRLIEWMHSKPSLEEALTSLTNRSKGMRV